jgi:hypothetical protein
MDELILTVMRFTEREELGQRLEGIRGRLGGGVGRLSVEEWRELGRELGGFSEVVSDAVQDGRLEVASRERLETSWREFVEMVTTEILPALGQSAVPSLTQEFRVHERVGPVVRALAELGKDARL